MEAVSDGRTREKIVVVCEPTTKIPAGANLLIKQIKEYRQAIEIHPEHRETSE